MQSFFFDRRSRKRNRRLEQPAGEAEPAATEPLGDDRRGADRRQEGRSTLDHYYAVHDMEVDDFADLETPPATAQKRPLPGKPES